MVCSTLTYSDHRSNSSVDMVVGTVVRLTCDEGFLFSNDNINLVAGCESDGALYPTAVWNVSDVICKRESIVSSDSVIFSLSINFIHICSPRDYEGLFTVDSVQFCSGLFSYVASLAEVTTQSSHVADRRLNSEQN